MEWEWFNIVAAVSVSSGIVSALIVLSDIIKHKQPMRIMNSVWVLTALWSGIVGLCVYFVVGRAKKTVEVHGSPLSMAMADDQADMKMVKDEMSDKHIDGVDDMNAVRLSVMSDAIAMKPSVESGVAAMKLSGMSDAATMKQPDVPEMKMAGGSSPMPSPMPTMDGMKNMDMGQHLPRFRSVVLSTLHCGAGCTLADIVGEWFLWFVPLTIGGSMLAGEWTLVYILALFIGVYFQYSAIREMSDIKPSAAVKKAFKADFFSLTAWQVGMYGWVAIMVFVLFPESVPSRISWTYWFMMQIAMGVGFCFALPVNYLLIRLGIKKAM